MYTCTTPEPEKKEKKASTESSSSGVAYLGILGILPIGAIAYFFKSFIKNLFCSSEDNKVYVSQELPVSQEIPIAQNA